MVQTVRDLGGSPHGTYRAERALGELADLVERVAVERTGAPRVGSALIVLGN